MKVIILCEIPHHYATVYAPTVTERLKALSDCDGNQYRKTDVLTQPERFADTEYVFSTWGMPSFTEEEIKTYLPSLKCVFYGAGSVQGFARPFLNCGVKVFSAWAANAVPVAEYTVAQMILAGKDFFCQSRLLAKEERAAAVARHGTHIGNYRKKVGLIGCGMIGSLVAEMLKVYNLEVLAYDPFMSTEKAERLGVTQVSLEELFASCSVVSNHLANNPQTPKILTYKHFSSMPPYAAFINTGRGAQVVEDDLIRVLTERPDFTAVLDVTDPEPSPPGHPFYSLPNCFMTPHIAGSMGGEVVRMAEYMVDEYEAFTTGKPVRYEVTLKMLETMA
ncbi:MAG: hydroxyacid dehydrogenase [Clostridia bacterium]|nr:hydroxyacid dehydrogenase [Clostridia bacterium]